MASLSRKNKLQHFSWQVLEDLVLCSVHWQRLAEVAQVLFDQQAAAPAMPVDPGLEALLPY